MDKIEKKLSETIKGLWKNLKKQENDWCNLNNDLDKESYSKLYNQQYYLLKYFPAYFTEYFHIWKKFFKNYKKESINILSIGCGAGIDFISFKQVLRIKKMKKIKYQYYGIDIVDWKNRPKSLDFEQIDIKDLKKKKFRDIDVIFFPKILTELKDEELEKLAKIISSSKTSSELYFINSYITNNAQDNTVIDGVSQFKIICQELEKENYSLFKNKCNRYRYLKEQQGLRSEYSFFIYPNEIIDKLSSLKCNCDKCDISMYPILNNKYIAYNILKFVKNDN